MTERQERALIAIFDLIGSDTVDRTVLDSIVPRISPRTFGCLVKRGFVKVEFAGTRTEFRYNVSLTERGLQKIAALKRARMDTVDVASTPDEE